MNWALVSQLGVVILLNALDSALGTLKTIFNAKKIMQALYITTFINAILFVAVMKTLLTDNSGWPFMIAYAAGKVIGVLIADIIEQKLAFGIIEADFIVSDKPRMKQIADGIRDAGFSVNTSILFGMGGLKRYKIEVTTPRKELDTVLGILKGYGYENPTFTTKEVSGVYGKFKYQKRKKRDNSTHLSDINFPTKEIAGDQ